MCVCVCFKIFSLNSLRGTTKEKSDERQEHTTVSLGTRTHTRSLSHTHRERETRKDVTSWNQNRIVVAGLERNNGKNHMMRKSAKPEMKVSIHVFFWRTKKKIKKV